MDSAALFAAANDGADLREGNSLYSFATNQINVSACSRRGGGRAQVLVERVCRTNEGEDVDKISPRVLGMPQGPSQDGRHFHASNEIDLINVLFIDGRPDPSRSRSTGIRSALESPSSSWAMSLTRVCTNCTRWQVGSSDASLGGQGCSHSRVFQPLGIAQCPAPAAPLAGAKEVSLLMPEVIWQSPPGLVDVVELTASCQR